MRETPDQQVKRDAGSRQGKCVCPQAHLTGLYTEVAAAIWLVSQCADSQYWLAGNRALAPSHANSRTFWGCWRMCALISGVLLFSRRFQWCGRHKFKHFKFWARYYLGLQWSCRGLSYGWLTLWLLEVRNNLFGGIHTREPDSPA